MTPATAIPVAMVHSILPLRRLTGSHKGPKLFKDVNIESGISDEDQLYDLNNDPQELHNLAEQYPDKPAQLKALLQKEKAAY